MITARERFEKSQNASIYISRIKGEHDEQIFRNYFSRFGSIKNCFIDKEKVSEGVNLIAQEKEIDLFSISMQSLNMNTWNQQQNVWKMELNIN